MTQFNAFEHVGDVYLRVIEQGKLTTILRGLQLGEKTVVIIDANNLICALEARGIRIDYGKLKRIFDDRCDLISMHMCIAITEGRPEQKKWLDVLREQYGYQIRSKYIRVYDDHSQKGNMDVEITIDAMKVHPSVEHVVLITGDSDFIPLVTELRNQGRRVSVVGSLQGDARYTSKELTYAANHFYDLVDLIPHLGATKLKAITKVEDENILPSDHH